MNGKKSAFITFYGMLLLAIAADSIHTLVSADFAAAWLGPVIGTIGVIGYFLRIQLMPIPRTRRYITPILIILAIAATFSIFGNLDQSHSHTLALLYMIFIFIGWLLYEFWYSIIQRPEHLIDLGNPLPNFTLFDKDNILFRSKDYYQTPLLLIFFRGNWSAFCVAYLDEVAKNYQKIANQQIQLLVISPQSHDRTYALAKKLGMPAKYLIDKGNKLAEQLGIAAAKSIPLGLELFGYEADGVLPVIILTNSEHKIIYRYIPRSHRNRPHILSILESTQHTVIA